MPFLYAPQITHFWTVQLFRIEFAEMVGWMACPGLLDGCFQFCQPFFSACGQHQISTFLGQGCGTGLPIPALASVIKATFPVNF